ARSIMGLQSARCPHRAPARAAGVPQFHAPDQSWACKVPGVPTVPRPGPSECRSAGTCIPSTNSAFACVSRVRAADGTILASGVSQWIRQDHEQSARRVRHMNVGMIKPALLCFTDDADAEEDPRHREQTG
ncbi:MAG: hypothetical protein KJ052_11325, partial [Candidatus Hydrogenedentes bacterium]|nr:hypothetical protein [Candidatus Hydrogenedentota bacterium]